MTREADTIILKVGLHLLLFVKFSQPKSSYLNRNPCNLEFHWRSHLESDFCASCTSYMSAKYGRNFNNVTTPLHEEKVTFCEENVSEKKQKKQNLYIKMLGCEPRITGKTCLWQHFCKMI